MIAVSRSYTSSFVVDWKYRSHACEIWCSRSGGYGEIRADVSE